MYQRRNPRRRRAPSVVSLLSEDTCLASSSNTSSAHDRAGGVCPQSVRSASVSSDRAHGVDFFDLTSNDFDVNQIQPSPPPSPPVTHTVTSGAALPSLSIPPSSTSPLPSSSAVTTDIEVIRTETVSSHNTISNTYVNRIINHNTQSHL